ncbi:hypothetical protein [Streptomyces roseoverticillatus]|uniref:Uncharacterized protein n=1 Tax=Streptomyces roseoverticillatus TaxID=66429 RepID=A0ABV3IX40_9ACTN
MAGGFLEDVSDFALAQLVEGLGVNGDRRPGKAVGLQETGRGVPGQTRPVVRDPGGDSL